MSPYSSCSNRIKNVIEYSGNAGLCLGHQYKNLYVLIKSSVTKIRNKCRLMGCPIDLYLTNTCHFIICAGYLK